MVRRISISLVSGALFLALAYSVLAQQPRPAPAPEAPRPARAAANPPPTLFFKETWLLNGAPHAIAAGENVLTNASLELKLYGPSATAADPDKRIWISGPPSNIWTGMCTTPCAVAFRDKNNVADLSGLARIKWVTKVSGFHHVRPIVKLADGTWLVGDHSDGSTVDWLTSEFSLAEVRWLQLDITNIVTKGNVVEKPDLTRVDEIGFADLIPGSGHGPGGWSDVAAIEVYGKPVKR